MVRNTEEVVTQAEFGEMVSLSQQTVSDLIARGILEAGAPAASWINSYCLHLRAMAEARAAAGDLDLATERARLAKERADRLAMTNHVMRKELAPTHLLEDLLAKAGARVAAILDTIPDQIAQRLPVLHPHDIEAIRREVDKGSAFAAGMSLSNLDEDDSAETFSNGGAVDADDSEDRDNDPGDDDRGG